MLLTPAQIKPKSFESKRNSFSTRDGCASCLRACLGARLLPQSYQYRNLSEGADRVGGQLRGDKECPFSGVTKSGRVWRKVPESDARSVVKPMKLSVFQTDEASALTHVKRVGQPSLVCPLPSPPAKVDHFCARRETGQSEPFLCKT